MNSQKVLNDPHHPRKIGQCTLLPNVLAIAILVMLAACDGRDSADSSPASLDDKAPAKSTATPGDAKVREAKLGSTPNVHVFEQCYFAGQPAAEDLKLMKEQGVRTVINLRAADELKYDEQKAVESLGMTYVHLPLPSAEAMTDQYIEGALAQFEDVEMPVVVHCGGAGRVGAIWMVKRAVDDGLGVEQALAEAREIGLKSGPYEARARDYIQRHKP